MDNASHAYRLKLASLDEKWNQVHDKFSSKLEKLSKMLAECHNLFKGCKMNSVMQNNLINDLLDLAK